jgi:hypothetical protein
MRYSVLTDDMVGILIWDGEYETYLELKEALEATKSSVFFCLEKETSVLYWIEHKYPHTVDIGDGIIIPQNGEVIVRSNDYINTQYVTIKET